MSVLEVLKSLRYTEFLVCVPLDLIRDVDSPMKKLSEMSVEELQQDLGKWQEANNKPLPAGIAAMSTMELYHKKITELQQELVKRSNHASTHHCREG